MALHVLPELAHSFHGVALVFEGNHIIHEMYKIVYNGIIIIPFPKLHM